MCDKVNPIDLSSSTSWQRGHTRPLTFLRFCQILSSVYRLTVKCSKTYLHCGVLMGTIQSQLHRSCANTFETTLNHGSCQTGRKCNMFSLKHGKRDWPGRLGQSSPAVSKLRDIKLINSGVKLSSFRMHDGSHRMKLQENTTGCDRTAWSWVVTASFFIPFLRFSSDGYRMGMLCKCYMMFQYICSNICCNMHVQCMSVTSYKSCYLPGHVDHNEVIVRKSHRLPEEGDAEAPQLRRRREPRRSRSDGPLQGLRWESWYWSSLWLSKDG